MVNFENFCMSFLLHGFFLIAKRCKGHKDKLKGFVICDISQLRLFNICVSKKNIANQTSTHIIAFLLWISNTTQPWFGPIEQDAVSS
jgi:hypothetical protein